MFSGLNIFGLLVQGCVLIVTYLKKVVSSHVKTVRSSKPGNKT